MLAAVVWGSPATRPGHRRRRLGRPRWWRCSPLALPFLAGSLRERATEPVAHRVAASSSPWCSGRVDAGAAAAARPQPAAAAGPAPPGPAVDRACRRRRRWPRRCASCGEAGAGALRRRRRRRPGHRASSARRRSRRPRSSAARGSPVGDGRPRTRAGAGAARPTSTGPQADRRAARRSPATRVPRRRAATAAVSCGRR